MGRGENAELAESSRQLLYAGEISVLRERLETARNETTDKEEKESLSELLGYYKENKDTLTGYYVNLFYVRRPRLDKAGTAIFSVPGDVRDCQPTLSAPAPSDAR